MSKHTPGSWFVNRFAGGRHKWAIGPSDAQRVCDAYSETDANLIAAAPELLEALIHLARFVPIQYDGIPGELESTPLDTQRNSAAMKARAAIARATGTAQ